MSSSIAGHVGVWGRRMAREVSAILNITPRRKALPVEKSKAASAPQRKFSLSFALWTPLLVTNLAAVAIFLSPPLAAPLFDLHLFGASLGSYLGINVHTSTELEARLSRIRAYEEVLRQRVLQLHSVLNETRELDAEGQTSLLELDTEGGIGEGDELHGPLVTVRPERSADAALKKNISLTEFVDLQIERLRTLPIGYPVEGNLSSGYGYRVSPFSSTVRMHEGVDITIDKETQVLATADGIVVSASYKGSYGNRVVIDHGNGVETIYAHLSRIIVQPGERVCRGEAIGRVGMSGHTTGPHVHYEIHTDGKPSNPEPFLNLAGLLNLVS